MRAMARYLVVIEEGPNNCSAYSPDVPGCVATGKTREQTLRNMREALTFHLEGLREAGEPIPGGHGAAVAADLVEVA